MDREKAKTDLWYLLMASCDDTEKNEACRIIDSLCDEYEKRKCEGCNWFLEDGGERWCNKLGEITRIGMGCTFWTEQKK